MQSHLVPRTGHVEDEYLFIECGLCYWEEQTKQDKLELN